MILMCRRWLHVKPVDWRQCQIGLEVHVQLLTRSKLFSAAPVDDQQERSPNSVVDLFDAAIPGTLPRLNKQCVLLALKTALLLNCKIPEECRFDRKHYFYADLPAGYQITQQRHPIAHSGQLNFIVHAADTVSYNSTVRIRQLQLEMDSGRSIHDGDRSLIDLNRAGVGLVEIVTEPDFHTAKEAFCFVEQLRNLLMDNGICVGIMHKGNLRVDVNISIGDDGTRTEIKNIGSLRAIETGIHSELQRQLQLINSGQRVSPETRGLDQDGRSIPMRDKEVVSDYRFMPEPNLPPLRIKAEWISAMAESLRNAQKHQRYIDVFGMEPHSAIQIAKDDRLKKFVDFCLDRADCPPPKKLLEWMEQLKLISSKCKTRFPPTSDQFIEHFMETIALEYTGRITKLNGIDLLRKFISGTESNGSSVVELIEREAMWRITDPVEIAIFVDQVLEKNNTSTVALNNRQLTRLRNQVITEAGKRIAVDDAAKALREAIEKRRR